MFLRKAPAVTESGIRLARRTWRVASLLGSFARSRCRPPDAQVERRGQHMSVLVTWQVKQDKIDPRFVTVGVSRGEVTASRHAPAERLCSWLFALRD